jgi:subtilisin
MRRTLAMSAAMVLLLALFPGVTAAADHDPDVVPNSWIVTLVDGADPAAEAPGLARLHGGQVGHVYEHALSGFSFQGNERAARSLERNPRVRTVVADRYVHATAESLPTGIRRIRARHGDATVATAHVAGYHGYGARIAILDTGIDPNHADLGANLDWDLGKNCIDETKDPVDGHGHGTHVAGTAAAVGDNDLGVVGVADQAKLVPVKVLDDNGSGSWTSVACGVDYVTGLSMDNDATTDVDVINMSLGGPAEGDHHCADGGLREAVCTAVDAGVITVVAAGNDSDDASNYTPAGYPEAVTVSALADSDGEPGGNGPCWGFGPFCSQRDDTFANFSNYGQAVDVIAPGYGIYSTDKGNSYSTKSGTSMAAPHVAGVAALIRAADPGLSPDGVVARMQATGECPDFNANSSGGTTCNGQGQWSGDPDGITEPLVNAYRAATASGSSEPAPVTDIAVTSVSAPSSVVQGDSVPVEVTVENVGNQNVTSDITVTLTDGTASAVIGTETISGGLTAGASKTLIFTWNTESASLGEHTLTASHDVTDDGNVDNDSASAIVTLEAATTDIAVISVSAPSSVVQGDSVPVEVTVENVGNQNVTSDITVTLTDGTANAVIGTETVSGGLTAGASKTLIFTWNTESASLGEHTLTASHGFTDDKAGNDFASTTVEVTEEALTMHVADLTGTSVSNGSSWTARVTVTIQGAGGAPVEGATVSFDYMSQRGVTGNRSCMTDNKGTCPVEVSGFAKRDGSVEFTVTDVLHSSLVYDNTSDVTSSITVTKP